MQNGGLLYIPGLALFLGAAHAHDKHRDYSNRYVMCQAPGTLNYVAEITEEYGECVSRHGRTDRKDAKSAKFAKDSLSSTLYNNKSIADRVSQPVHM